MEYFCLNSLPRTQVLPQSTFTVSSQVLPYSSLFPVSGNSWKEIFIAGSEEAKVAFLGMNDEFLLLGCFEFGEYSLLPCGVGFQCLRGGHTPLS